MVALNQACRIIEAKFPEFRILWGLENDTHYYFRMERRSWDGNGGAQMMCQGVAYGVNKETGNCDFLDFEMIAEGKFQKIDNEKVFKSLSKEDELFARKIENSFRAH